VVNPFRRSSHREEAAETYLRTSRLLLQAIGLHAVEGEPHEYESFRATIEGLQAKLSETTPLPEGLIAVGAAAEAMHDYGLRTTRFTKAQNLSWRALVRMLVAAVGDFAPTGAHSAELREIDWKIGKASTLDDIRDLRKLIKACLAVIRNEIAAAATKVNGAAAVAEQAPLSEKTVVATVTVASPMPPPDSSTGLLARCHAEAAMRESKQNGSRSFATIFVIDRLRHINLRFGQPVGDRLTVLFLQRLASALLSEDRLFRWGASSFVALLENRDSQDEVRRQIERILFRRLVETFTVKDQSVMVPISATWNVVPIAETGCDEMVASLDAFVAQNMR
jgi:GGDEF domain-containing protein